MFMRLAVQNFRGVKSANLSNLGQVNLLTGSNSAGKTSLLEAIFLLAGANNPTLIFPLNAWRGWSEINPQVDHTFKNIFWGMDVRNKIRMSGFWRQALQQKNKKLQNRTLEIEALLGAPSIAITTVQREFVSGLNFVSSVDSEKKKSTVRWKKEPLNENLGLQGHSPFEVIGETTRQGLYAQFISPRFQSVYDEVATQLSDQIKSGDAEDIINLLQVVEPGLKRLLPLSEAGKTVVYADIGHKDLVPIYSMGTGAIHYLRIALATSATRGGIMCVDEIETGLHYSVIDKLVDFIFKGAALYGNQIFITTHSEEVVTAFLEAAKRNVGTNFALIRAVREERDVIFKIYEDDELALASEMSVELR